MLVHVLNPVLYPHMEVAGRRGFTIRLKRLSLGTSISTVSKILGVRTISSISVFLLWFNAHFFTMPLTKDLYRRMSAKD